jgi:ribonuclease P protein component
MPSSTNHRLRNSPNFRLRKHADYQRVYKAARKQFGRQMAYFFATRDAESAARSDTDGPRIGLTVPKALGNAVTRNRIKRRLRAAVRAALPALSAPVDVLLHPKRSALDAEFALIQREVETIFRSVQAAIDNPPKQQTRKAAQRVSTEPLRPRAEAEP